MVTLTDLELRILEKGSIACDDVTSLLGSYVDNELIPSLRARVEDHIESCALCKEGEAKYREVIQLARELPQPEVPNDVQRRLRLALNARLGIALSID